MGSEDIKGGFRSRYLVFRIFAWLVWFRFDRHWLFRTYAGWILGFRLIIIGFLESMQGGYWVWIDNHWLFRSYAGRILGLD